MHRMAGLRRDKTSGPVARGARSLQQRQFSTRAFFLTCAFFGVFAIWRFGQSGNGEVEQSHLLVRDVSLAEASDEACRLVHRTSIVDKCAYVRKHCPAEEPGFLSYLELYYCDLGNAQPVAFIILVSWLATLFSTIGIAASDFFCINLSTIATILGMSESLAGVTFLAFGNGSPDVFSTFAAMSTNSSSLAIGELIGAAGFITAVVAGSMALVRPFRVAKKSFVRDVGFFAVAAAFSMGFLSDGHLHLWECIVMVAYYFFYVGVVVIWHWWMTRRAKRRQKDAAARGHFNIASHEDSQVEEEYRDDPDEETTSRYTLSRGVSTEDFRSLENGGVPTIEEPIMDEEEQEREWLGEISSNMRLVRAGRHRSNTITPVRPSLVGALEFQAVISSLNRSRNIQPIYLHARRHSEDATAVLNSQFGPVSAPPEEHGRDVFADSVASSMQPDSVVRTGRARAVSTSDIPASRSDSYLPSTRREAQNRLVDISEDTQASLGLPVSLGSSALSNDRNTPAGAQRNNDLLAPPGALTPRQSPSISPLGSSQGVSPRSHPRLNTIRLPSGARSPLVSQSPTSPFPPLSTASTHSSRAPSLYLPPPASTDSGAFLDDDLENGTQAPSWWPSNVLPTPANILSTLFPTLYHWKGRTWFELALGIVAAPSVLLLTLTLPVVEADPADTSDKAVLTATPADDIHASPVSPVVKISTPEDMATQATSSAGITGPGTAGTAVRAETAPEHPHNSSSTTTKPWNRWLTITQLYLAPLMIVLIIYTQYLTPRPPTTLFQTLLRPCLISLLISTILLIPLLLTSTSTHRPRSYIPILSLFGFTVSIAWISTIASQVVAVLKTLAIILNMSHAILGLTVFAVGNSLGDLVADITVARLGYPVMALSACFGGPMLNILLGIGLSGCWILIRGASKRHARHPDKEWHARSYEIEVGDTLIVSGVTLLVGLVGLLIAVPLNGWMMSRRIAVALIVLWCVATIVNVVLEVVGVGGTTGAGGEQL